MDFFVLVMLVVGIIDVYYGGLFKLLFWVNMFLFVLIIILFILVKVLKYINVY